MMPASFVASSLALAVAAASPGARPATEVAPVVVTAHLPPIKDIPALVHAFGRHPYDLDALVRWQVPLCPVVIGPPKAQADYIVDRLRSAAGTVGIPVGRRHCTPDLIVVLTPNFDEMIDTIAERGHRVLGVGSDLAQYSEQRIAFTRKDTRPYHEFAMTTEVLANHGSGDGEPLDADYLSAALGGSGLSFTGIKGPPIIDHATDSLITPDVDYSLVNLVLVIDQNRLKGLSLQQVPAYVLMLSLAQVDDSVDGKVDTILRVADPSIPAKDKPQDLTFWDRVYLGALYRAWSQRSLGLEEGEITTAITHAAERQVVLPKDVGLDPSTVQR